MRRFFQKPIDPCFQPVRCSNLGCSDIVFEKDLNDHLQHCSHECILTHLIGQEDLMVHEILPFLDFSDIVSFDSALTNRKLRRTFMSMMSSYAKVSFPEHYWSWSGRLIKCMYLHTLFETLRVSGQTHKSFVIVPLPSSEEEISCKYYPALDGALALVIKSRSTSKRENSTDYPVRMRIRDSNPSLTLIRAISRLPVVELDLGSRYADVTWTSEQVRSLSACSSLTHLSLKNIKGISDADILHLASKCPSLVLLNVKRSDITDRGMLSLMHHLPSLAHLYVKRCPHISEDGLLEFHERFPHVQLSHSLYIHE